MEAAESYQLHSYIPKINHSLCPNVTECESIWFQYHAPHLHDNKTQIDPDDVEETCKIQIAMTLIFSQISHKIDGRNETVLN